MLKLKRLENDDQLTQAIIYVDEYLDANDITNPELDYLAGLVCEYEKRTDILNRNFRI